MIGGKYKKAKMELEYLKSDMEHYHKIIKNIYNGEAPQHKKETEYMRGLREAIERFEILFPEVGAANDN